MVHTLSNYTSAVTKAQSNVLELTKSDKLFWQTTHFKKGQAPLTVSIRVPFHSSLIPLLLPSDTKAIQNNYY